jgi:hypothetical protein
MSSGFIERILSKSSVISFKFFMEALISVNLQGHNNVFGLRISDVVATVMASTWSFP